MLPLRVFPTVFFTFVSVTILSALAPTASAASPVEVTAAFDRDKEKLDGQMNELIKRLVAINTAQNIEIGELRGELDAVTTQLRDNRVEYLQREAEFKLALSDAEAAIERERAVAEAARRSVIRPSEVVGGTGGKHRFVSAVAPVRSFTVWHKAYVNAISFNDAANAPSVTGGVQGAPATRVVLNEGETIVSIRVEYQTWIDGMVFTSSQGRTWRFGGNGGHKSQTLTVPAGDELVGISGLADRFLDCVSIQSRLK